MSFDFGGVAKGIMPIAGAAIGGPIGGIAGSMFADLIGGAGGKGGKGGAEGINALTSMFTGGADKAGGKGGIQPDIAKLALSLFKEATTPEQKSKLLDVAIKALGGDPSAKTGGSTALSSPGGMNAMGAPPPAPANDEAPAAKAPAAKAPAPGGEDTKVTYEKSADGSTKVTYEHTTGPKTDSTTKADSASKTASTGSSTDSSGGMTVKGDTVDTGRYTVTASKDDGGTVKVFDKQTNTFVKAFGDPHVQTSDGDKMQFQKNGLSIKLPDGTSVHMKPTEPGKDGKSYIASAMVEKDGKAVTMDGLHDGNVKTSQPKTGADELRQDYTTQGQTVLDASSQDVGDLFMTGADGKRTKEIVSPKEEMNLDGMGGALNTKDGEAAGEAKGKELPVNPDLLEKGSQILHLVGANVTDPAQQKDLLQGLQSMLEAMMNPAQDEAA